MVVRRRAVLALGAGALAAPFAAFAQQKVWRIGFLSSASATGYKARVDAFVAGMNALGYELGRNIVIEYRWAEGRIDRLPGMAEDLVKSHVDVIVTHATPPPRAARQASSMIPIVIAASGDAVATGLVKTLAKPGGNITGTTFFIPELTAKRLELLKEALPHAKRMGLLQMQDPITEHIRKAVGTTAATLGVKLIDVEISSVEQIADTYKTLSSRVDGVVIPDFAFFIENAGAMNALALKHRIPSAGFVEFATAGGLIGYGVDFLGLFRRAAYFVDKIFKGIKPADIPVEQPTKFETIVNLKTARTLGIKIPDSIRLRADRVIE